MARIPILDLSLAESPTEKSRLLAQLHPALFDVGFLYIVNHGVPQKTISKLTNLLPSLFSLPDEEKTLVSKLNSPHFLGYSGFGAENTLNGRDLREQFDFATELPVVYNSTQSGSVTDGRAGTNASSMLGKEERDFTKLYWRLRGPNQWPAEDLIPGFRGALNDYHDAVQDLSYRFVHLIEEAFEIPIGTFDLFFGRDCSPTDLQQTSMGGAFLPPQHRIKLLRYSPTPRDSESNQGVGAHKDSSGWLTFLYQVENEPGLEVLSSAGDWIPVKPIEGSFVVNFGNAFEAATEGAVKATVHRVVAPGPDSNVRYSIPFFQGLPLNMTLSQVRNYIPQKVRSLRKPSGPADYGISSFLDPRWDSLGESQLRKWIRSHKDVALKHYGPQVVDYYTTQQTLTAAP